MDNVSSGHPSNGLHVLTLDFSSLHGPSEPQLRWSKAMAFRCGGVLNGRKDT